MRNQLLLLLETLGMELEEVDLNSNGCDLELTERLVAKAACEALRRLLPGGKCHLMEMEAGRVTGPREPLEWEFGDQTHWKVAM